MTELLTAAQMRAIEQAAIETGQVTGLELMERAGRGVVAAIFEHWPELRAASHRGVVLCGPGNNGGDGFVVARLLKEWGWEVDVYLYGDPEKLPPDARVNYARWAANGRVASISLFDAWNGQYDLGIDAVFGTGLSRPVSQNVSGLINSLGALPRVVAVDFPSGLCSDSGKVLSENSDPAHSSLPDCGLTVTFQFAKTGHVLSKGFEYCGVLKVVDIGLDRKSALKALKAWPDSAKGRRKFDRTIICALPDRWWFEPDGSWSLLGKEQVLAGHKYSYGHALILSGGITSGGAARLAARGALRIGAGVATLGCPPSAVMANAGHLNAIMLRSVADADALQAVLEDDRINALCLGPGMGVGRAADMLGAVLDDGRVRRRATVIDADALTALAQSPDLFAKLHESCILTPHAGEFARLFPDLAAKLNEPATSGPAYSKLDATRDAAKRAGCVVLFKGPDTVIAHLDGRCTINAAHYDRAAPWLATAGSGDVLAGFITGLLARGLDPMQAAETGAWLHVECARAFGPGLIAEDLPEALPGVFRQLGL
jgi:hydroxyethylthiazole kinase-like uncharacterized protein yjeF